MTSLISSDYQALLKREHKERRWGAASQHRNFADIKNWALRQNCRTILDFGAGCGALQFDMEAADCGISVTDYDPGTASDHLPGRPHDLLVSCDVLEHIEFRYLPATWDYFEKIAVRAMYHVIATRQAKARLVDGSVAHLIVEPADWWLREIRIAFPNWKFYAFAGDAGFFKLWMVRHEAG